jgi:16S rRNA (guanine527-N7)-methyltransferase
LTRDALDILQNQASRYKLKLSPLQHERFRIYLNELWDWNQKMNLTGLATRERVVTELFLDSLIPAPILRHDGRLLDAGSGSGVPGIPLKIYYPQLEVSLLEPNAKKVSFLKQVIRLLGLEGLTAIRGRVEDDSRHLRTVEYSVVTVRALAALNQTISWCAPYIHKGGLLVCYLGSRADEALQASLHVMEKEGLDLDRRISYILPGKTSRRTIVLLRKGPGPT